MYVQLGVDYTEISTANKIEEILVVTVITELNDYVDIGIVYRSPSSSVENTVNLIQVTKQLNEARR
jgi:hypothetical protein